METKNSKIKTIYQEPFLFVLDLTMMNIARRNAEIIVQNTTIYPFKLTEDSRLLCVYCCDSFILGSEFKEHVETEHPVVNISTAFAHVSLGYIKGECSELLCRVCYEQFDTIEDIAEHLVNIHDETDLMLDNFHGIMPFQIANDKLCCAVCGAKTTCFRALSRHTQSHFCFFTCELCESSFSTPHALQRHVKLTHVHSSLQCPVCKEEFEFTEDLKQHYLENKRCCKHLCRICGDRFACWSSKQIHMAEVHEITKTFTCHECGMEFQSQDKFRVHFVIEHTNDYFQCEYCEEKFRSEPALKRHTVIHTREKQYPCSVCGKAFYRKSTLNLHMWIHSDVKQYECEICEKQFNQKVIWKNHVAKYHAELLPEIVD